MTSREEIASFLEELAKDLRRGESLSGTITFLEEAITDIEALGDIEEE